tara:strand:- start:2288 stop:3256 length:969 start_codon:yes stop_codon:yes gene_type:complete
MVRFVCLAKLFPAAGIPGVLGITVEDDAEIEEYRDEMGIDLNQSVQFVRLTAIPEHAQPHLRAGDVVCKFDGLSERFLDVLRPVETAYMHSQYKSGDIDWDLAEDVRSRSIEKTSWELGTDNYQVAICDPFGRLAVFRMSVGAPRKLFKTAYVGLKQTKRDRDRVEPNPAIGYLVDPHWKHKCSWATFRFLHKWIFDNGPVVDPKKFYWFKKILRRHNDLMCSIPMSRLDDHQIRMHTRRKSKDASDFWSRVRREYLVDEDSLPRPLSFVGSKREVRWVRITLEEAEGVLDYMVWPEWSDLKDPIHFSALNHRTASGSKAWN